MNEALARQAIQTFMMNNSTYFTQLATVHGEAREITQYATSKFAYPRDYPFVRIVCNRADAVTQSSNAWKPKTIYSMDVMVADMALGQQGDSTPYEEIDMDFRVICDRMVGKILDEKKFCSGGQCFSLMTDGDVISKENVDAMMVGEDDSVEALMLGSSITFDLEECK